jgi:hypothetical protein
MGKRYIEAKISYNGCGDDISSLRYLQRFDCAPSPPTFLCQLSISEHSMTPLQSAALYEATFQIVGTSIADLVLFLSQLWCNMW